MPPAPSLPRPRNPLRTTRLPLQIINTNPNIRRLNNILPPPHAPFPHMIFQSYHILTTTLTRSTSPIDAHIFKIRALCGLAVFVEVQWGGGKAGGAGSEVREGVFLNPGFGGRGVGVGCAAEVGE